MTSRKFIMIWSRLTLVIAIIFFISSRLQDEISISIVKFVATFLISALLYCSVVVLLALIFWAWNGNGYIKKNLPSEDVINP